MRALHVESQHSHKSKCTQEAKVKRLAANVEKVEKKKKVRRVFLQGV